MPQDVDTIILEIRQSRSSFGASLNHLSRKRLAKPVVLLVAVVLCSWFISEAREFLAIDQCLDSGGQWDDSAGRCERWVSDKPPVL